MNFDDTARIKPRTILSDLKNEREKCPVCGETLIEDHCKLICISDKCVHRIVKNCSEF